MAPLGALIAIAFGGEVVAQSVVWVGLVWFLVAQLGVEGGLVGIEWQVDVPVQW